ncbi:Fc.00g076750.m01.CDS01 [Cosmosporella sp. VM-42]
MADHQPYVTIRSRQPVQGPGARSADVNAGQGGGELYARSATHDTSRTSFHVKHISQFAKRLEDSAARAFPNRGRSSQRYKKVQVLLLHWNSDDLFVIPELEDLEKCLREDYSFNTDIFGIPSENSHLELMLRIGQLIKDFESPDTLFMIYYGGHARIDESRQSTWCATRDVESPWLQWSAIQTLLERSKSDVLILLDCCAGAASATFPSGTSITETISASSWDAIAPDPGRYSFTNALIEVLQEWRLRTFSAAMLHAEVLARLKHPRPITINGKHFEARSTPVHFMMTSNHKAPSIEMCRTISEDHLPPSPQEPLSPTHAAMGNTETGRAPDTNTVARNDHMFTEPNEDTPHVMISLALEDDQRLDINAWEQWINAFPAMAKYVKVQGVFKSHSTLLLVSMPVTVWDMLPEDHATSFIAFIRSNNLMVPKSRSPSVPVFVPAYSQQHEFMTADSASFISGVSGTTFAATENMGLTGQMRGSFQNPAYGRSAAVASAARGPLSTIQPRIPGYSPSQPSPSPPQTMPSRPIRPMHSTTSLASLQRQQSSSSVGMSSGHMPRQMIINQQQSLRRTTFGDDVPEPKKFSAHVEKRLEEYYQHGPLPNDGQKALFASNLGVEPWHIEVWFHHRRERDAFAQRFASLKIEEPKQHFGDGPRMILPANLNELLEILPPSQVLLFDLRSQTEYQRSHIHGGIHLRAPQTFLRPAPLEMVEQVFPDEQSRQTFSNWKNSRCIVFYSRGLESPLECPSAEALLEKFWAGGWNGQCFILKGHYREFSDSFEKHIFRSSDTAGSGEDQRSPTARTSGDSSLTHEEYTDFVSRLEKEGDQLRYLGTSPNQTQERITALVDQENDLEVEFQSRFPDLYKKAQDAHGSTMWSDDDSFVTKAQMVEYLDRGLTKMRDAHTAPPAATTTYEPGHSKLAADNSYFDRSYLEREADDFVEVGRGDEQDVGKGKETRAAASPEEMPRRGRGGGLLNKVFRRT